jgi:hypothetical protein
VHAHGVDIGPVQQGFIRRRIVGVDALDQLVLAKDLLAGLGSGRDGRRSRIDGDGQRRKRARIPSLGRSAGRVFRQSGGGRRFES